MRISMSPKTAHFKSGILFFNLREARYEITDENIQAEYDLCFLFDNHAVYVAIDPSLEFGVMELSTKSMYGPYNHYMSVVSLHLFGKYDNLISFLRESFPFDNKLGAYRFVYNNFNYARGVYEFTENISKTTRDLFNHLPAITEIFEYESTPTTYFSDGALEIFVNKLNVMFNQNNFTEESKDTDNFLLGSVDRASGYGMRQENGKAFFCVNLSKRRHSVYFAPKRVPVDYIDFISNGSQDAEDVVFTYVTSVVREVVSNKSKVDFYKNEYGLSSTETSVELALYDLFNEIIFILTPTDDTRTVFIFVRLPEYGIIPLEFDSFTKRFTVYDAAYIPTISNMMSEADIELDGNTLKFAYKALMSDIETQRDLAMKMEDVEFYVDCSHNRAYTNGGNVFAINYAGNLLNKIFV